MEKNKGTISTFEFFQLFPDERAAVDYIESRRWADGVVCPFCESKRTSRQRDYQYHRCKDCRKKFTVRTDTIYERSHIPLNKWLYAMYLLETARKGISSLQLSKELGITQKAAWFLLHRLREACDVQADQMRGEIEIDEAYFGGKEKNKHASKKLHAGRGAVGKQAVLGMRERDGRVFATPVKNTRGDTLKQEIIERVEEGSTIYTDEYRAYNRLESLYERETVRHKVGEYVNGKAHTNGIESVWAVLKRGYNGVYHHWSKKHMRRYVNEFVFRFNEGNVQVPTMDRLDHLIRNAIGKRLTYQDLTE